MSHRALASSLTRAVTQAGEAATCTAVTLAARMPMFAQALVVPNAAATAEWNAACNEKITAVWEGMFAAGVAWQRTMLRSAFSPPTPLAFANEMVQLVGTASGAARRRVRSNAMRLSKRKKSSS